MCSLIPSVISSSVERFTVDTAEVSDARERDGDKLIEEFVHFGSAQSYHCADSLVLSELEVCNRLFSFRDDGLLSADSFQFFDCETHALGVVLDVAQSHIDDDLFESGDFVYVFITFFFYESGNYFLFVLLQKTVSLISCSCHN